MRSFRFPLRPDGRPFSLLVADDVPEIRALLHHWLTAAGGEVACAASGQEVSRLIADRAFDLAITDILMPDGDGLEAIAELRRMRAATPVLAMSGGGSHLQALDCLKFAKGLGAQASLLKPFTREQLFDAVTEALANGAERGPDPAKA